MLKKLLLLLATAAILQEGNTLNANSFFEMAPLELRDSINTQCMNSDAETPQVGTIKEQIIETAERKTPVRIYTPQGEGPFPLVLFIHGGAWVGGSLDTHDNLARYLCKNAEAVVISVGYQLAPEGKFPLQLEQCYDTLLWAQNRAKQIAVAGDSAGGNMAAALCLMARDREGPPINLQVLINPAPDLSCEGTLKQQGDQLDKLRKQALLYVNKTEEVYNPYVSPYLAKDLSNLPPAMIILAEQDDLRCDGERYADKLRTAHIPTNVYCQWGTNHLAGHGARASKTAIESLDIATAALRGVFTRENK